LIKVGAFDRFGKRSQLLEVLDQMVAQSASVFAARDSGQLSMFDLMSDLLGGGATSVSPIALPNIEEAKGRDRLQWEKELLGVYAMSHPLQAMSVDVRNIVTCGCSELDERFDGKNVLLVGMIASVRTINTKKGDQMAFVQLEDMGGQGEVVVFPRTYAEVKEMLLPDSIVMVKGKAQTREGQTSLLADSFQNYVDQIVSVGPDPNYQKPLLDIAPTINGFHVEEGRMGDESDVDTREIDPTRPALRASSFAGMERFGTLESFGDDDDNFLEENPFANEPPAWLLGGNSGATVKPATLHPLATTMPPTREEAARDNPYLHESRNLREEDSDFEIALPKSLQGEALLEDDMSATVEDEGVETGGIADEEPSTLDASAGPATAPPALLREEAAPANPYLHESRNLREEDDDFEIPLPKSLQGDAELLGLQEENEEAKQEERAAQKTPASTDQDASPKANTSTRDERTPANGAHSPAPNGANGNGHALANGKRTMQIIFRPSGDVDRDKYRLKEIVETVRDPKGRDQFVIVIKARGKTTTLAFPDDPCSISDRLRSDLGKFFRVDVQVVDLPVKG
jgi:hypothetical protein